MAFEATELAHEGAGVRNRRVLFYVGGFIIFTAVLIAALALFYRGFIRSAQVTEQFEQFPGPQLQPNPGQDYTNFRHAQDAGLQGYGWANDGRTRIHVPIGRAMAYVAGRGADAFDPVDPASAKDKLPPTPADGESRASTFPHVAPYGVPK